VKEHFFRTEPIDVRILDKAMAVDGCAVFREARKGSFVVVRFVENPMTLYRLLSDTTHDLGDVYRVPL
jgi:hypothetical protein